MAFAIERLPIPASVGDHAWADFAATIDARNVSEIESYGTSDVGYPPEELLPFWLDPHEPKVLWGARLDGQIVGRAVHEWSLDDEDVGWIDLCVNPDARGRGIGRALADAVEEHARRSGRQRLISYVAAPDAPGDRITPPTGAGSIAAHSPGARFLVARDWRLEQVTRASRIALPLETASAQRLTAVGTLDDDYRIHAWVGPTPDQWLADQADLYTQMSIEEPTAGLDSPEQVWDEARVRQHDALQAAGPVVVLTAAAEYRPTGRLVGFTQLSAPRATERPVTQSDTLVVRGHRGHRLGMLMKLANLDQLSREAPGHPSVLTWNAEENRPMLSVNEAVGFVRIGSEGAWRKDLR